MNAAPGRFFSQVIFYPLLLCAIVCAPSILGYSQENKVIEPLGLSPLVKSTQKISNVAGNLPYTLPAYSYFGTSTSSIGDLDGDGVTDIAVSAPYNQNKFYILFLNTNGTVKAAQEIGSGLGGFPAILDQFDQFGWGIANLGDLDGDSINDLAVTARQDDAGGTNKGALYILFMNANGTVSSYTKVYDGFNDAGGLDTIDFIGNDVTDIGDLDNDGVMDIVVGGFVSGGGATGDRGVLYTMFLNTDGTVKSITKNGNHYGNLNRGTTTTAEFGQSLNNLGDIDGDGQDDLGAGSYTEAVNHSFDGASYTLLMNTNGTVKQLTRIAGNIPALGAQITSSDYFGHSIARAGDVNGDGASDMIVGAIVDDDGGTNQGALYLIYLDNSGGYVDHEKISESSGGLGNILNSIDYFGTSLSPLGDIDGDGGQDFVVGAFGNDDGGDRAGAVYIMNLNPQGNIAPEFVNLSTAVSIDEETTTTVQTLEGTNPDQGSSNGGTSFSFAITGGADAGEFTINTSGSLPVLEFTSVPDFENPTDTGGDNVYNVDITIQDNGTPAASTTESIAVTINDTASVTVGFDQTTYSIDEDSGSLTINLSVQGAVLSGNETVDIINGLSSASSSDHGLTLPQTITIPAGDYSTPVLIPVSVPIVNDDIDEENETLNVVLTNPSANISTVQNSTNISITDNDTAGIDADNPAGIMVSEDNEAGSFLVELTSQPLGNVTILVSNNAPIKASVSQSSLVFTPSNWDTPQEVVVTGLPDDDASDENVVIGFSVDSTNSSGDYSPLIGSVNRTVFINDNDEVGLDINPVPFEIQEGETINNAIAVKLTSQPIGPVDVTFFSSDTNIIQLSNSTLSFTAGNWNIDQYIVVQALEDTDLDNHQVPLTVELTVGRGSDYENVTGSATVNVIDNDLSGDDDNDGITNGVENSAINNGDGNNDGVADFTQDDVATIETINGDYITLDGNGCGLNSIAVVTESELDIEDSEYDYPLGLIDFTAVCSDLTIDIYAPNQTGVLRKFIDVYDTVEGVDISEVVIDSESVTKFTYQVLDGGILDASPAGDGIIRDPVGIGVVAQSETDNENNVDNNPGLIRTGGV